MKPVFIFSLPRSGSTLLQRILTSHTDICSSSEPWLLLPYIYAMKRTGTFTEYSHFTGNTALNEFIDSLPNKYDDFASLFNTFVTGLYTKKCINNEIYFIDKTPRYYLIIPEIINLFPDAKFIFLFRNPAHVYSSIISTFGKGKLNKLHGYQIDIQTGPEKLASGYNLIKDKAYRIQYEDLIMNPEQCIHDIFDYLELSYQDDVLTQFSKVKLNGSMGDPTGVKKYSAISTKSLETWQNVIDTKYKKHVLASMVKQISSDTYRIHGYNRNTIISEVNNINTINLGIKDLLDYSYSKLISTLKLNHFFSCDGKWARYKYLS